MKTIKSFLAATALFMGVCACSKLPQETVILLPEEQMGEVSFTVSDAASTKLTNDSFETAVHSLQVAVFKDSGMLVAYGKKDGSNPTVTLNVPVGGTEKYKVWAYVNGTSQDLSTFQSDSGISNSNTYLDSNLTNNVNGLEMWGSSGLVRLVADSLYTIPVKRYAAKVEIDKIEHAVNSAATITIDKIYLINVNKSVCLNGNISTYTWCQQMKYVASETPLVSLTSEVFATPVSITPSSPHTTPHYFYCYANVTNTDATATTWSPRFTRLVVEATYNGTKCYYPINVRGADNALGPLQNTLYKITSLKITGPGSTSPDKPLTKGSISVAMTVQDWTNGFSSEVTI